MSVDEVNQSYVTPSHTYDATNNGSYSRVEIQNATSLRFSTWSYRGVTTRIVVKLINMTSNSRRMMCEDDEKYGLK